MPHTKLEAGDMVVTYTESEVERAADATDSDYYGHATVTIPLNQFRDLILVRDWHRKEFHRKRAEEWAAEQKAALTEGLQLSPGIAPTAV